jgi:D-alanine--D-alanine ligase
LEKHEIPFVGSGSAACKKCFDKFRAAEFLRGLNFFTIPDAVLKIFSKKENLKIAKKFFTENKIDRAVVKPARGGSSIGVFSVGNPADAVERAEIIFKKRMDTRVVLQPFCRGVEFTTIVLQNKFSQAVALLPTEMEVDYQEHQIFDFRKKYLPTRQVHYHCPPRFSNEKIEEIQIGAEQLFTAFGMKDFARIDGWVLENGQVYFSDFNPTSGMEQNSFLFQQSSRIGFSHRNLFKFILKNSLHRQNFPLRKIEEFTSKSENSAEKNQNVSQENFNLSSRKIYEGNLSGICAANSDCKKIQTPDNLLCKFPGRQNLQNPNSKIPLPVIFGGESSERQVSLLSGTNVWLKLRNSKKFAPEPFLLDAQKNFWRLPYALTLNHTVEEILQNCQNAPRDFERLKFLREKIRLRLAAEKSDFDAPLFLPEKISLEKFIQKFDQFFIGLHGGWGEDGELQKLLEKNGKKFNGAGSVGAKISMDKFVTAEKVAELNSSEILPARQKLISTAEFLKFSEKNFTEFFQKICQEFAAKNLIVKPRGDGCSSGIVKISSAENLQKYAKILRKKLSQIPAETFPDQNGIVEMPTETPRELIFEKFIETDAVRIKAGKLNWVAKTGWVETTVGLFEISPGKWHVFAPSLTVADGAVLSVEEKFQGGTGVNLTPPPKMSASAISKVRESIARVATKLELKSYARIDAFVEVSSGKIQIIEANSLPALTPSTVIFQQALVERPAIFPR